MKANSTKPQWQIENNSQSPSSTFILPSPITLFPNLSSIAAAVPSRTRSDILITYCLTSLSWHLSVLHAPTFMEEYTLFWAKEEAAFASTHPAWLALYFSLLTVGAALSTMEQQILLGCDQGMCLLPNLRTCRMLYQAQLYFSFRRAMR